VLRNRRRHNSKIERKRHARRQNPLQCEQLHSVIEVIIIPTAVKFKTSLLRFVHWFLRHAVRQQVLVDGAPRVELGDSSYRVGTTQKTKLKSVDFDSYDQEFRGLEQNPATTSRWAKLTREGKKIMQFLEGGRYIAVVADGECKPYPRGKR